MTTTPETTAWVQQEVEKAVAPLRQQIDVLDDWSNGVFAALADLMPLLLKSQPDIAASLAPLWREMCVPAGLAKRKIFTRRRRCWKRARCCIGGLIC
ncbi:MAG: hypothetical protein IPN53_15210 [Comamonadaceae bacterium]|nr:hypothetical protein [Comamonadaceae bacterium]